MVKWKQTVVKQWTATEMEWNEVKWRAVAIAQIFGNALLRLRQHQLLNL